MSEDQFTRLFKYMTEQFQAVHDDAATLRSELSSEVSGIYNILDGMAGSIEDIKVELAAHSVQLSRHEQAVTQLAAHLGTSLSYD